MSKSGSKQTCIKIDAGSFFGVGTPPIKIQIGTDESRFPTNGDSWTDTSTSNIYYYFEGVWNLIFNGDGPLISISAASSTTGPPTSGPITVTNGSDIRFVGTRGINTFTSNGPSGTIVQIDQSSALQAINFDAGQRLRVSEPYTLLQIDLSYDLDPINLEVGVTGAGHTAAYNSNQGLVDLILGGGTGEVFAQSYAYAPYQNGKSHEIFMTFILGTGATGVNKRVGYFDSGNGVYLEQSGNGLNIVRRSNVSGSVVNESISQANWNTDKMNGTGPSGIIFDPLASQVLFIDLQYLGHGSVRVGLFINGCIFVMHQFMNANNLTVPYMRTATLPVQATITGSVGSAASTLKFKSACVQTEGEKLGPPTAFMSIYPPNNIANAGQNALSIRPKLTFQGRTNRSVMVIDYIEISNNSTSQPSGYVVSIGQVPTGAIWEDVNTSFSAFEFTDSAFNCSLATGITIAQNILPALSYIRITPDYFYPISLSRAGANRNFGMITVWQDLNGSFDVNIKWKEYR
jgi:hypothetical protein